MDCPHAETATCPIQGIMLDVRNAIASVLDHYSLEDFVYAKNGPQLKGKQKKTRREFRAPTKN
jgi:DNA-binding IscR family transcriptional regulator